MPLGAVECVWQAEAELGEGPVWLEAEQALYFVDLLAGRILRYRPAAAEKTVFLHGEAVGFVAPRVGGGFVAGTKTGFQFLDLDTAGATAIASPEAHLPDNRFNDGKVDPSGRLWAGTVDMSCAVPTGSLYRLETDLGWGRADTGYLCPNGPAFSLDGRTLYHSDSMRRTIYVFDLDLETGALTNKRIFALFEEAEGYPDGMTVDSQDTLWVAHYGAGRVTAFRPDGTVDRCLTVPAPLVTSCAFGGEDLRTLYITTANLGLTADQRAGAPLSGSLFAAEGVAQGQVSPPFGG